MTFTKENVISILNENSNKKVSSIINIIEELKVEVKIIREKKYLLDSENKPFAIFCYYHKQWELISETEYGTKSSSKTGLNTMCKLGTNKWTKQQKTATKEKGELLIKLMDNEITQDEIKELNDGIEERKTLIDLEGSIGYTFEEIKELLNENCE